MKHPGAFENGVDAASKNALTISAKSVAVMVYGGWLLGTSPKADASSGSAGGALGHRRKRSIQELSADAMGVNVDVLGDVLIHLPRGRWRSAWSPALRWLLSR
jgi:hypothetical protein